MLLLCCAAFCSHGSSFGVAADRCSSPEGEPCAADAYHDASKQRSCPFSSSNCQATDHEEERVPMCILWHDQLLEQRRVPRLQEDCGLAPSGKGEPTCWTPVRSDQALSASCQACFGASCLSGEGLQGEAYFRQRGTFFGCRTRDGPGHVREWRPASQGHEGQHIARSNKSVRSHLEADGNIALGIRSRGGTHEIRGPEGREVASRTSSCPVIDCAVQPQEGHSCTGEARRSGHRPICNFWVFCLVFDLFFFISYLPFFISFFFLCFIFCLSVFFYFSIYLFWVF